METNGNWSIRWYNAIADISPEQWDCLALPLATPLLEWHWLHALETSGSISPSQGWYPCHLTLWQSDRLIAAAPLYIKTHSQGEFVFDGLWARLAATMDIAYYPKLVGMSPATPAVGYRFLVAGDVNQKAVLDTLFAAIDRMCAQTGIAGCHLNFVDPSWGQAAIGYGYSTWQHQSFLWRNQGFAVFEDYLKLFKTNQRRNIRRERKRMANHGIGIETLAGDQIPSDWAGLMYQCYVNTNAQYGPWAAKFLNEHFFDNIFQHFKHRLLVVAAVDTYNNNKPMALSMLVYKGNLLIGRYWGATRHLKDLHFNLCFYAPIQWAIQHGIAGFDPGAGSAHKIQRGFEAVGNISLHRFYHPQLKALFRRYIDGINQVEQVNIDALNEQLPFSKPS